MEITQFEDLRITTETLVMSLTNGVSMEAAFHLLPITRIEMSQTRESSKCKLPHCQIPGSILSMRYRDDTRGVIKSKASSFKNAVTIDISTKKKNISLKLSPSSIQMCGASSKEDGVEAATHVLSHLKRVQDMINRIQENETLTMEMIQWVKTNTKGNYVEKPTVEKKTFKNVTLNIYKSTVDNCIVYPQEAIPSHMDEEIVKFMITMGEDFLYHQDFCKKLYYLPKFRYVIDEPPEILSATEVMVNYNFHLGFEVDRALLNQYIDGREGFISRFNNALSTSVTIELPYDPPANRIVKTRSYRQPHFSFLVYLSGSVTYSGPCPELMSEAYYKFRRTILELKPFIEYRGPRYYAIQARRLTVKHGANQTVTSEHQQEILI
jgi:hypothetical protein